MSLLNWFWEPCEACTTCVDCGDDWCREEIVSPGEDEGVCVDCWESANEREEF